MTKPPAAPSPEQAENELESLRRRVAELEEREAFFRSLLDLLPHSVYRTDREGRCTYANRALLASVGMPLEELQGKTSHDLYPPELAAKYAADDARVLEEGITLEDVEEHHVPATGETLYVQVLKAPVLGPTGEVKGIQGIFWDVTARYKAEQMGEELNRQASAMRELGTPLLPIAEGVLVMPLIGEIDEGRVARVMETLLEGISSSKAAIAILDVTGVKSLDNRVADALLRVAQAVNLLGARVVLTGINPELAQTLVTLGVELGSIVTQSTLENGVAFALGRTRKAKNTR